MIAAEDWVRVVTESRDSGLVFFDFLTAVDLEDRLEVVVHLWDPQARTGVLLTTGCPSDAPAVPTLTGVFQGAAWHERAAADLFGITFEGHATEPLLLSPTFEGNPLRKEFVLAARAARPWPGLKEPGESDADVSARPRRRVRPPGVPKEWDP